MTRPRKPRQTFQSGGDVLPKLETLGECDRLLDRIGRIATAIGALSIWPDDCWEQVRDAVNLIAKVRNQVIARKLEIAGRSK